MVLSKTLEIVLPKAKIPVVEFEAPAGVLPLISDKSPKLVAFPVVENVIFSILLSFDGVLPAATNP